MHIGLQRHWCIFTSAGDKNVIHHWLEGNIPQRFDLIVAYYGENNYMFYEIDKICTYAFRTKGSKFQNLKKLILQNPKFFDQYSYVWICDDDIPMSSAQINEAFELAETLDFWVAQPAMRPEGKNGHWITCFAGAQWDYRIVNFVEVGLPIFRCDKLIEFLSVYDGSLTGWGIDHWYANLFKANDFGRFAVFDRIQVLNPRDEAKGGNEMGRLRSAAQREADWKIVRQKFDLVEYPPKIFAYCKLAPKGELFRIFDQIGGEYHPIIPAWSARLRRSRVPGMARFVKAILVVKAVWEIARRSSWYDAIFFLICGLSIRRQRRAIGHGFEI
ncbi:MAG TPA: hypothetical protein VJ770_09285 [Stellaceae bacterium]|nr:hypothetical protein [Stellaceae bacterium]